ncbi:hypothetical protein [Williamsia sp. CHRR-6]|uniref:hypothetical protein n=1 Tax=Williamsia sp. CHRR-6 TaxID=2835871 RepID=UPI001BD9AC04|nr:hypothetical protein [Williamsia sp. CHRR-6]MBT0566546.1 hypothetical protein [Williamsia sp. CHRR-6]
MKDTYRRPVTSATIASVALVVVAVIALLPNGTDGSARATAAFQATEALDRAGAAITSAPGVRYTGAITVRTDPPAADPSARITVRLSVTDLVVTASGDVRGQLGAQSSAPADYLQVGAAAIARGPQPFWRGVITDPALTATPDGQTWGAPDPRVVPDLGALLRPASLISGLAGVRAGASPAARRGDVTPDTRRAATSDPAVTRSGSNGLVVGGPMGPLRVGLDRDGTRITSLSGRLDERISVELTMQTVGVDEVKALYRAATESAGNLAHAVAPYASVSLARSSARPVPGPCGPPNCDLEVTVVADGPAAPGPLTVVATTTITAGQGPRQVGRPCVRSIAAARNSTTRLRCTVTFLPPGPIGYRPTFAAQVFADTAPAAITAAITANQAMCTSPAPGRYSRVGTRAESAASDYGTQITGLARDYGFRVGEVVFDGRAADGVLLVTRGPGYATHVERSGAFDPTWPGTAALTVAATASVAGAKGAPLRWVFAEPPAADAFAKLLAANKITGIDVVTVPVQAP